jgi:glucose-fructose oxidoreductase
MKSPHTFTHLSRRRFLGRLSATAALALMPRWSRATDVVSPPEKKFGVALVGLGGYSTGHLGPALRLTKHCRLTGVVTGSQTKGKQWARDYGFSEKNIFGYETMASMAGNRDIDIVYVVTPNGLHAEHCIAAAKAGKHVICEKPMATSVAECDAIIAACRAAGVKLSIGYRLHFEPHHLEFARLAREQTFGPFMRMSGANGFQMGSPEAALSTWRTNKKLAGGGPLMDMGVYVVQAACMGKAEVAPTAVTAKFDKVTRPELFSEVEESVKWTMEFADGATAQCHATYAETVSHFRAEAARGWAELGEPAFSYGEPVLTIPRGQVNFPLVNQQVVQLDGIAKCLASGQPSPVPGDMGRRDLAIIEAIYAAAKNGQRVEVKV